MDVLNERLRAPLKREKSLLKLGERKARIMLAAGRRWEKQQIANIKKLAEKKTGKAKWK